MTTPTGEETQATTGPTLKDRAIDAVRRTAHVSHEAQLLKTVAADTIEDGMYAARRAAKMARRRMQDAVDARHEVTHRIRREPIKAVGIAFGAGLVLGGLAGWIGGAVRSRPYDK